MKTFSIAFALAVVLASLCLFRAEAYAQAPFYQASLIPRLQAVPESRHSAIPQYPSASREPVRVADIRLWSRTANTAAPQYPGAPQQDGQQEAAIFDGPPASSSPQQAKESYPAADCTGSCASGSCTWGGCMTYGGVSRTSARWFGGIYGLAMTRDRDGDIFAGYDDADPTTRLLTSRDASMTYAGGAELHLGRSLGNCWAVEGVYWGIYPSDQVSQLFASDVTGNVDSPFEFNNLEYDNGSGAAPAGSFFDDAQVLRVLRSYEYHNFELNLLRRPLVWRTRHCRCARVGLLAGVRYFEMEEGFDLDSDIGNNTFGDDPASELFYDVNVRNQLIGFQIGGMLDYGLTDRISFRAGSKMGVYGNRIRHRQSLASGNGVAMVSAASPLGDAGSAYSIRSTEDDVAFIGELLVGLAYRIAPRWSVTGGYRAMAVSGVALPTGQIPLRFDDLTAVSDTNSSGSLILHGAYAGLEYNW